jgi:CelD/BcsL family acetyltransferase involved in cellulose biosynthesis
LLKIREVRTFDELQSLSKHWDRLLGTRGEEVLASNFLWVSTWWAHLGRTRALRVLIAEDDNRIVGIAPLYNETLYRKNLVPLKVCCFIGDGLSDYGCLLAGDDRAGICALFLNHLKKSRDWHELQLHNIPDTTGDFERLCAAGAQLGFRIHAEACESNRCFFIRTEGDFADYSKSLGRNLRHDVAKRQRRLNEAGGFEVKFTQDIPFATFLDAVAAMHTERQRDLGRQSFFEVEKEDAFVREILSEYHQRGWLEYVAMMIDDQLAAYRLGFRYGGVVYDWNTGFDPQYNTFSVGKVLLYQWLQDLFRRPDVREFNFMRGESDFKKMFASEFRLNRDFSVRHPRSLYARGITLAETIWRATKSRTRQSQRPSGITGRFEEATSPVVRVTKR